MVRMPTSGKMVSMVIPIACLKGKNEFMNY